MKKYTKKQRKAIHTALVAAVPWLWDGLEGNNLTQFICLALLKNNALAREMIAERLGKWDSVRDWLRYECKIPKRQLTKKNVQAYRHRWLAALIEEFSK